MQPVPIIVIEFVVFGATLFGIWDTIAQKWRTPITPELLARGRGSLRADYRRKVERTIGGWLWRAMLAVEVGAKRFVAKRNP